MVKRKRIGSCSTQDDRRSEESTTPDFPSDAGDVTQQQSGRTRSQHAPRTTAGTCGTALPAPELNPSAPEKAEIKGQSTPRSSCRVVKRLRKDASPPPPNNAVAAATRKANTPKQSTDSGKTRRPWEQWSTEDKNSFFEALCEYGKDFESIQSYIAQRSKKKGVPLHGIKNKDQVRHFYYRTWHKISKVMDIGEDVKKQTQELYGLINYAELRKKYSPSINERNGQLLTELVLNGSTMVKIKGKRVRIKTPLCRALKKLNNVEDAKDGEPAKLPQEIYVELRPRCNAAWAHVQSLAQNPRVRTKTGLQRRLSTIIEYLQQRWQPLRIKQKEQIISALPSGVASVVSAPVHEKTLELRVWPSERIRSVNFSTADATLNVDISLEGYKKNTGGEGAKCRKPKQPKSNAKLPAPQPSQMESAEESPQEADAASSGTDPAAPSPPGQSGESNPEDEAAKSLSLLQSMLETPECSSTPVRDTPPVPAPPSPPNVPLPPISNVEDLCSGLPTTEDAERMTLGQLLGLAAGEVRGGTEDEEEDAEVDEGGEKVGCGKEEEAKKEEDEEEMAKEEEMKERYEKGWSAKEAELLTVGELCLMMGRPKKIVLYYDFSYTEREHGEQTSGRAVQQFATVLKKLVSLASAMFSEKNKQQGPMSPPGRGSATGGSNCSRANATGTPPSSKSLASRAIGRSPSTRSTQRPTLQQVQEAQVQDSAAAAVAEGTAVAQSQPPSANSLKSDQHVFVVPVGTAPRSHKSLSTVHDAVQEQIDKLLPAHRRGNRMRTNRKPVVVQRPLLPRADQRPVTVVQLLPSAPTLTTLVQSQPSATPLTAAAAPASIMEPLSPRSNMVSLLSTGPAFDVQVPLSSASTGSMLLPVTPQAVIAPTSTSVVPPTSISTESVPLTPAQPLTVTSEQQERSPLSTVVSITTAVLPVDENANCCEGPTAHAGCLTAADCNQGDVAHQVTLPGSSLSLPSISSLLDISLPESLPAVASSTITDEGALLNFAAATASSATFGLPSKEEIKTTMSSTLDSPAKPTLTTPPMSPFKLVPSTPDSNWLNGESSDFSLSSLLNTLDSPSKTNAPLSASGCPTTLGSESSNLDPIARLAPDVDTQLQCLMNENSVDYVAKFADLAAQIASSNVESKSST